MEAGGAAGGRGAVAVVGVGAAAAGEAQRIIRVLMRMHLVLSLAGVVFALCVATLHPWVRMRTNGLLLLLSAGALASAAAVAAFAPDARRLPLVMKLHVVGCSTFVAALIVGSCAGHLHIHWAEFIADDVLPLCVFLLGGLTGLLAAA